MRSRDPKLETDAESASLVRLADAAGLHRYVSPIKVFAATPLKTGRSLLRLEFFNAMYAQGVQGFTLDLRVLKHRDRYMIAEIKPPDGEEAERAATITTIDFDWLGRFCPELCRTSPPPLQHGGSEDQVGRYLDDIFGVS